MGFRGNLAQRQKIKPSFSQHLTCFASSVSYRTIMLFSRSLVLLPCTKSVRRVFEEFTVSLPDRVDVRVISDY